MSFSIIKSNVGSKWQIPIGISRVRRVHYHDDDEIQPTPSVSEIFFKSKSQPLDQHLNEEDDSEDSVHVV